MASVPSGLGDGGERLWSAIADEHDLDAAQLVQLEEACRAKDRLDKLDSLLRGDIGSWLSIAEFEDGRPSVLVVNSALKDANATANLMKQLLAALRLPDAQTGKKPQFRGPRGAQKPSTPGGKVSSLERARQRSAG